MRKLLCIVAMLMCGTAIAASETPDNMPPDWNGTPASYKQHQAELSCRAKGDIFRSAAELRDQGNSPEGAFPTVAGGWINKQIAPIPGITKDFVKNAINAVYFDPAFANAGGPRLAAQIENLCLSGGKPRFKPLR